MMKNHNHLDYLLRFYAEPHLLKVISIFSRRSIEGFALEDLTTRSPSRFLDSRSCASRSSLNTILNSDCRVRQNR